MAWKDIVEAVKKIPIPEYMEREVVPKLKGYYGSGEGFFQYRPVEKCPFHNEDTASFRYYEETNTCACFGCRRGGDVINLHRVFYETNENIDISYKDAVMYLYNTFIGGSTDAKLQSENKSEPKRQVSTATESKSSANELENTESELAKTSENMRFNRRVYETERKLRENSSYSNMMLLDFVCKLHRLNEVTTDEAAEVLKNMK